MFDGGVGVTRLSSRRVGTLLRPPALSQCVSQSGGATSRALLLLCAGWRAREDHASNISPLAAVSGTLEYAALESSFLLRTKKQTLPLVHPSGLAPQGLLSPL